jgi:hypothetical protein
MAHGSGKYVIAFDPGYFGSIYATNIGQCMPMISVQNMPKQEAI